MILMFTRTYSAAAAEAPEDEDRPPPVEFQPESVAGEMREYQLEGLKWLVARFDDGINTILADEMARRLPLNCEFTLCSLVVKT